MKTKAACEATGLTRKTLLFYEEKGLFSPHKTRSNGRDYRDYTQEDIVRLKNIATLRRAWFTIDEIKRMKEAPEDIEGIFSDYHAWLKAQKKELNQLLAVADAIELTGVGSMEELIARMEDATESLPLPEIDVNPHFRYLDAIEERPRNVIPQTNFEEDGDCSQAAFLVLGKQYRLEDYYWEKSVKETKRELQEGTVVPQTDHDSKIMRVVKKVFMAIAIVAGMKLLYHFMTAPLLRRPGWPWAILCIGAGSICGLLELISWKRQQKKWQKDAERHPWPEDIAHQKNRK